MVESARRLFSLILIFLLVLTIINVSLVVAKEDEIYSKFSTQGEEYQTPIGKIHLSYPKTIAEGEIVNISLLIEINSSFDKGIEKTIQLKNEPFNTTKRMSAGNTPSEDSYLLTTWNFVLWSDRNLSIEIKSGNKTIFNQPMDYLFETPKVLSETVLDTHTSVLNISKKEMKQIQSELKKINNTYYSSNFNQLIKQAEENNKITKQITQKELILDNNKTELMTETKITITPLKENQEDINIIIYLPKEIVSHTDLIKTEPRAIILKADPMIMWHIKCGENATVKYTVRKNVSVTGNAVVFSDAIEKPPQKFPWKIIPPLLIIPLVAGVIIFFARYEPKD